MRIIVGLGNPGQQYENTRHNIGFMALDALAKGFKWKNDKKLKANIIKIPGAAMSMITNGLITADTILVKPQTFMNNSGPAVSAVLNYFLPPDKGGFPPKADQPLAEKGGYPADLSDTLTVIHDDLNIELGKFKISVDSRSAGHKGVESIIDQLKTKNFRRVRIGIKTPALEKISADKFVLQKFSEEERKIINTVILNSLNKFK